MRSHPLCAKMHYSRRRVHDLLRYLRIGPRDATNLDTIHRVLAGEIDDLVREFYVVLGKQEHLRHFLGGEGTVERLEGSLRRYLTSLGQGIDRLDYFEDRLRIGYAHEGVGLGLQWYLGMYPFLFDWIARRLAGMFPSDPVRLAELLGSLQKVITLDGLLVVETYHHASNQRLEDVLNEQYLVEQDLRITTTKDSLTGVLNRQSVLETIEVEFLRGRRFEHDLSLLLIDIDDFKSFNDRFGHRYGDYVLRELAQIIASTLRPGDVLGRYGGDELLVALPACGLPDAMAIAERIRLKASLAHLELQGVITSATLSIGVAATTTRMKSAEQLLERADRALYLAKRAGRNRTRAAVKDGSGEAPPGPVPEVNSVSSEN